MAAQPASYPVTFTVDTPEKLSRWLWLFKWLLLIPHMIIVSILGFVAMIALFISWIAILITGSHPKSLWDFLMGVNRWSARINGYALHMTDTYPPFSMDELPEYPVRVTAEYSDKSNRLTTFFRFLLIIPQLIVVWLLSYVLWLVYLLNIIFAIFTGKPNTEIFNFMVGILRWQVRVNLYWQLITDRYPPFSME